MKHHRFRHRALIYEGIGEYLAGTAPFVEDAVKAGEPILVAVGPAQTGWLQRRLNGAGRRVRFVAMEEVGRNPASIIPLWRDFVDEHAGRPVRGVGEPVWAARSPAALEECHRHDALLNLAFAEDPDFQLLCPYDAGSLPSHVLERIVVSHGGLDHSGHSHEGSEYDAALDAFAGELPPPTVTPDTLSFGLRELAEARHRVAALAERAGLDATAVADLITAAGELAANSIMHGGGSGTLRLWQDERTVLVEVEDRGLIEEPLVGRLRPGITQEGGRGLWLANQLCDLVQIRSGEGGTVVRLHMLIGENPPVLARSRAGTDPRTEHSNA